MIQIKDVAKSYRNTFALEHVSLDIPDQGIYCLLGRNGAGKTTFMKLLAGHIGASEGSITVDGENVSVSRMPQCVNYIESHASQFNMKVSALIHTAADLQEGFDQSFAMEMAARYELDLNKKYKQLSFGMRSMLTTIMTLANNSKVILLDEPTLGFDAIMREQFNTLLLESYHAHPRVMIVSTHLIDEIAKLTERLIIIEKGRILLEAGMDEIDEKAYTLFGMVEDVVPLAQEKNCIGKTMVGNRMAAHMFDDRIDPPDSVTIERLSLQDFFINIVGGDKL